MVSFKSLVLLVSLRIIPHVADGGDLVLDPTDDLLLAIADGDLVLGEDEGLEHEVQPQVVPPLRINLSNLQQQVSPIR